MTTTHHLPAPILDTHHVILGTAELMDRYGLKKTSICALVKQPMFPGEIAPRRWRLDHILDYEDAKGRAGRHRGAPTTAPVAESPPAATTPVTAEADLLRPRKPRRGAVT
jgi:hypothetical protein